MANVTDYNYEREMKKNRDIYTKTMDFFVERLSENLIKVNKYFDSLYIIV